MADPVTEARGDDGFAWRVMRTTAIVAGVFLTFALLRWPLGISIGFVVGVATAAIGFLSWKLVIDRAVRAAPGEDKKSVGNWVLALTALKLPLMGGLLAAGLFWLDADPWGIAGGVTLVPLVVVLKQLGHAWFGARSVGGPTEPTGR